MPSDDRSLRSLESSQAEGIAEGDIRSERVSRREVLEGIKSSLVAMGVAPLVPSYGSAEESGGASPPKVGPRKVRSIETVWIPMSDGVKIAARIWLPEDADKNPVPALMEYIPYRRRDRTRLENETLHGYLASHGYACVRPDTRGAGDSGGLPVDEYVAQEQSDGVEIIAWLAKQPWCTGKVGMFGISWGGFSALQVAAHRPPALKAIITHCSTDDRYTDDCHYTGGCINDCMFWWGSQHTTNGLRPPDPTIVGDGWRDIWLQRLNNLDFYVGNWFEHQHRDAFWKHASIDEDYSSINCAVYAVGGWADPYHSTVPRMLAHLKCPRKGLIGPWGHQYPLFGVPGPAIDWMSEALRWWDFWLKGTDTGIMSEPMYRVWMQEEPTMRGTHVAPGRWVAEDTWPSPRTLERKYYLTGVGLEGKPSPEVTRTLRSEQTVGITAPTYWVRDVDTVMPTDQRVDDVRSLTFDSPPLAEGFEILGAPVVTLNLAVDKPVAFLYVRLNQVDVDGVSKRVSYGVLNLTHRNGHESPQPLEPGKRYRIQVQLFDCGLAFKAGTRLRIALSTTCWPMIWPSPEAVTLTVYAGESNLELPIRQKRSEDSRLKPFGAPFIPPNSGSVVLEKPPTQTSVYEWDLGAKKLTFRNDGGIGRFRLNAPGSEMWQTWHAVSEITEEDPTSAKIEFKNNVNHKRGDWDVTIHTTLRLSVTKEDFQLFGEMVALDKNTQVFSKSWNRKIPRELV